VHPHTLLPPHTCGNVQLPQFIPVRVAPQLSAAVTLPQFLPRRAQNAGSVSGMHVHTLLPPHTCGAVHVPQLAVRAAPQLSAAAKLLQFLPRRLQNAGSVSGVQPHTFAVPLPPHATPVPEHVPQLAVREAPQLSVPKSEPQFLPPNRVQNAVSVSAVQPHTFTVPPPPHVTPVPEHVPQPAVRATPQLSLAETVPQFLPRREQNAVSFSGMQPHTFGVTAPHVWGAVHVPHGSVPPQPSDSDPQFLPSPPHVDAVQPQTFVAPPPPHVFGDAQAPHEATVRDRPQLSVPKSEPQSLPSRVQNAVSLSAAQPHTFAVPPAAQL
jgi:hypothetical protein